MAKYRVATDQWLGFSAEVKYWWWPFCWIDIGSTYRTADEAEEKCKRHATRGRTVKYLGHWSARRDEPEVARAKMREPA